jgi:hypothetical protein
MGMFSLPICPLASLLVPKMQLVPFRPRPNAKVPCDLEHVIRCDEPAVAASKRKEGLNDAGLGSSGCMGMN